MSSGTASLQNRYLQLETNANGITVLRGRFADTGGFSQNLLSARTGIGWGLLERLAPEALGSACGAFRSSPVTRTAESLHWHADWFFDGDETAAFSVEWRIALPEQARAARVTSTLTLRRSISIKALTLSVMTPHWFLAGLFERGVVQQVKHGEHVFASSDALNVFYTVGHDQGCVAVVPVTRAAQTLLCRDAAHDQTGVQFVLAGRFPLEDTWHANDWSEAMVQPLEAGESFTTAFDLYANDLPFPTHTLEQMSLPTVEDTRTHLTNLYAVQVGCLGSYQIPGSAYPTIAQPNRHYGNNHTFFDPDAWSLVSALSYSGDPYLEDQARQVLELALSGITASGQIPHHFTDTQPTYVALSGAPQTGPNIFWSLAVVDYVSATGDAAWLRRHWFYLRRATAWVLEHYDGDKKLLCVSGPLWVDVFKRDGYAFDTNVMAVHFLRQVSSAASLMNDHQTAQRLQTIANEITVGLEQLFDGNDHYITSKSRDWQKTVDMIDADNYAAIAFGVTTDPERIKRIFARLDSAPHTHPNGRGTWISEVYYDLDDCYLGNTGDSACAFARHYWIDLRSRHAARDTTMFNTLFENVRQDLFAMTWMTERYDLNGEMIRAPGYHEYPGILAMTLRENRYGININLENVEISPLSTQDFTWSVGQTQLEYRSSRVAIRVAGQGQRNYKILRLEPSTTYRFGSSQITSDSNGKLEFRANAGELHVLERIE